VGDRDRALDDPAVPVRAVLDRGTGLAGGGLPHHSPEPPLSIHLERCSIDLVAGTFMAIEKPETGGDPPEGDDYTTLGQIVDRTIALGAVFPTVADPSTAQLPAGSLRALSQLFNDCYCLLLRCLERIFNGAQSTPLVAAMFTLMTQVLPSVAGVLVRTPIPGKGVNASPSFEFSNTEQSKVLVECEALVGAYPELAAASQALQKLAPIDTP
jgi:hypothetical protein